MKMQLSKIRTRRTVPVNEAERPVKKRKGSENSAVERGTESETINKTSLDETPLRKMDVLFSPYLPNLTCYYIVDSEGVKGYDV